jgi:hypothetical protein
MIVLYSLGEAFHLASWKLVSRFPAWGFSWESWRCFPRVSEVSSWVSTFVLVCGRPLFFLRVFVWCFWYKVLQHLLQPFGLWDCVAVFWVLLICVGYGRCNVVGSYESSAARPCPSRSRARFSAANNASYCCSGLSIFCWLISSVLSFWILKMIQVKG